MHQNKKSGLFVLKIGYRQVARLRNASKTKNLAFWPQKSTTDRWRDGRNASKQKIWPFCLKNRLQTGGGTAGQPFKVAEKPPPPPHGGDLGVSGRERSAPRKNEKSGLFVSKIGYRQVTRQPDAVFRVQYKPLPPPHGGPPGVLAAKKRKIWPFCLKNRLQTGDETARRRVPGAVQTSPTPARRRSRGSGPRTKRAAKKRKIWPFCLKNRLQTGGGTAGRRVPGAVQTSPTPARRRSRVFGREETKNLAFLS